MASVDIFWSFRSPYSYLAMHRLREMSKTWDIPFNMRPVYPIAVRIPGFFKQVNPMWPPYLIRDTVRIAEHLNIPYSWPNPDPVVMDISTGEVPEDQPYIHRLTRLGQLATQSGDTLAFFDEISRTIWSDSTNWTEGDRLKDAAERAGYDLDVMDKRQEAEKDALEAAIQKNEADQKEAGHWGVPLMAYAGEPFFGQDRLDLLEWRLEKTGVAKR